MSGIAEARRAQLAPATARLPRPADRADRPVVCLTAASEVGLCAGVRRLSRRAALYRSSIVSLGAEHFALSLISGIRRFAGIFALLAQLVEHFHGKEGVDGSSPSEGFIESPRYGGVSRFQGSANL